MILPMTKITFLGLEAEKSRFLQRLQEVCVTHLIMPAETSEPTDLIKDLNRVIDVRKFLARKGPKGTPDESLDYGTICSRREDLGREESTLQADIVTLKKQWTQAEPWGDFSVEDVEGLKNKGLSIQFFRVPRKVYETLSFDGIFHQVITEKSSEFCFATFGVEPVQLGVIEEKAPAQSAVEIERAISYKQAKREEIEKEYVALAQSLETLEKAEASITDMLEFKRAVLNSREELDNRLFILQCWSPVSEEDLLRRLGGSFKLYHYAEEPDEQERMPVKLENPPAFESGEDLVRIYSYPSAQDFDPTPFVLYCFVIFFGMIVGDFGYGLVLLGLTVYVHRKLKGRSPMAVRMVRLMYMLSGSVLVWGVIGAGFFGMTLEPDHPLVRISVMDYNSQEGQAEIMIISIIIGMVHICLSLLIRLYKEHDLSCLGWIVAIWSAFFYLNSKMAHNLDNPPAMYGLIAGLSVVFLFSSKSRNPLLRVAEGLQGLLGVIQIFSDVLSYLRLFALGVATVYIAQTFNILAESVSGSIPVLGMIFAGIILLLGHTLNLGLAIMGGVIHGLRLNFLEWYRWCFEGDGLEYKPFQRIGER